MGKSSEDLELERIQELRKAAGGHLQESKKSFKKVMAKHEESSTKESNNQHIGTKRRVCFICMIHLIKCLSVVTMKLCC